LEDLLLAERLRPGNAITQYFYAFFLLLVWLLITNRVGRPEPAAVLVKSPGRPSWANIMGFFPGTNFSALTLINERRCIAQELHDGVGLQLVNLLVMLDARIPAAAGYPAVCCTRYMSNSRLCLHSPCPTFPKIFSMPLQR
jgi:hypothetical protein